MKTWCASALAGAVLLSVCTAVVQAQSPDKAQQDAIRSNCRSDFMRNCSSVPRGGREALDCLMQNKAKASAGCQGALNAIAAPAAAKPEPKPEPKSEPKAEPKAAAPRTEPAPTAAAPAAPAPAAAPPPQAPTAAAPTEPRAKPKPAPKVAPKAVATPARPAPPVVPQAAAPTPAVMPVAPPPAAATQQPRLGEAILIRRFCTTDFKVLCKGVPLGQGRAIQCLANNGPALSPGCRQAMTQAGELRP